MIIPDLSTGERRYNVILADPPWQFTTYSAAGMARSPEYATLALGDLCRLPVPRLARDNCVLLLWATDPRLPHAFSLMDAWGFTYKTVGFYWVKQNLKSDGFFTGLGYWTRANPEQCLLGTRGSPKRLRKDVKRLLVAPRREHSRKPDEIYDRIEALLPGPYVELFARQEHPGWDAWGNEVGKFK